MLSIITQFIQEHIFLPSSLLLLLLVFTYKGYKWILLNSMLNKNSPPPPPALPVIGNLHQLGKFPHRSLSTLSEKYGDLMLLHLGSKLAIAVSSAKVAFQVLKTHDLTFASRPNLTIYKKLLYDGKDILSSPYGEHWKKMRSICVTHLLNGKRIRSFRGAREEEVATMMKSIQGVAEVNLSEIFMALSNDMVCKVVFGKKYRREKDEIDFEKLFDEFMRLLGGFYVGDFISWLAWIDRMHGVDAKARRVSKAFDDFLEVILEERSALRRERRGGDENEEIMRDFVDVLLDIEGDGQSLRIELDRISIKCIILDMFTAGVDTTYIALEWIMSELLKHSRVMEQVQTEVREIIGDKERIAEDDIEKMKYLKAVIKETLRLHPPVPLLPSHESTQDVKINDWDILTGTQVIVNTWAINRDPTYWEEPNMFFPDRFLNSSVDFKGQDFQLIPFGSGRRGCPGIAFAVSGIELVMANLLYKFDWELPNGVDGESLDMMEHPGITVRRKTPLLAIPTPRC